MQVICTNAAGMLPRDTDNQEGRIELEKGEELNKRKPTP
jgi:hypothetical protein